MPIIICMNVFVYIMNVNVYYYLYEYLKKAIKVGGIYQRWIATFSTSIFKDTSCRMRDGPNSLGTCLNIYIQVGKKYFRYTAILVVKLQRVSNVEVLIDVLRDSFL